MAEIREALLIEIGTVYGPPATRISAPAATMICAAVGAGFGCPNAGEAAGRVTGGGCGGGGAAPAAAAPAGGCGSAWGCGAMSCGGPDSPTFACVPM
jgi:hypothetical protein